jgi:pimeloyl-ACP methyl ester carboxylesterase
MPTTATLTPPSTPPGRPPGVVRVRSSCACVGHTRLHDRGAGDGPPVLVHGYGAASSWWCHDLGPSAEQRRVYAPDLAGCGSSRPKHPFSLERTVECLDIPRARGSRPACTVDRRRQMHAHRRSVE